MTRVHAAIHSDDACRSPCEAVENQVLSQSSWCQAEVSRRKTYAFVACRGEARGRGAKLPSQAFRGEAPSVHVRVWFRYLLRCRGRIVPPRALPVTTGDQTTRPLCLGLQFDSLNEGQEGGGSSW